MKVTNFTAPRSLSECHFIPSADPIERPHAPPISAGRVWVAVTVALVLAALSVAWS
jgi:hypothetical protein